ncbi:MAG: TRAP transporter substrate-binding protein [Clostridia bacterium]
MKKVISTALVCLLMVSLMACAAKPDSTTPAPAEQQTPSNSDKPATPKKTVTLSLNHVGATDHPYQDGSLKFAELVEKKTNGSVKVDVFPSSQLASGAKAIEFVQMGTLDVALESTMSLSNFVPEIGVLDMPFVFDSKEEAFRVLDGGFGKELGTIAEKKGFKILGWWDNGFRTMSNSKRAITQPSDLAGLKIRVPESKIFLATFEQLGAVPTPMAVSEVFTAIQLGTVDGQENTSANFFKNKYAEVNDYYSVTNHIYTAEPLIMSVDKFNSFTAEEQKAIMEAAKEAGVYQREVSTKLDESLLKQIKDTGINVNIIEDLAAFKEAVQPVYKMFEAEFGTLLKKIDESK